jgi:hypothetical protein
MKKFVLPPIRIRARSSDPSLQSQGRILWLQAGPSALSLSLSIPKWANFSTGRTPRPLHPRGHAHESDTKTKPKTSRGAPAFTLAPGSRPPPRSCNEAHSIRPPIDPLAPSESLFFGYIVVPLARPSPERSYMSTIGPSIPLSICTPKPFSLASTSWRWPQRTDKPFFPSAPHPSENKIHVRIQMYGELLSSYPILSYLAPRRSPFPLRPCQSHPIPFFLLPSPSFRICRARHMTLGTGTGIRAPGCL